MIMVDLETGHWTAVLNIDQIGDDVATKAKEKKKFYEPASTEQEAWADYLEACRGTNIVLPHGVTSTDGSYEDREPWAWARLQTALQRLQGEATGVRA